MAKSFDVKLESDQFRGTIVFWPKSTFEFLFLDADDGEVLVLKTVELESAQEFQQVFTSILEMELPGRRE